MELAIISGCALIMVGLIGAAHWISSAIIVTRQNH